ncbi:FadR/GntR family transcriptional regulator [Actinomyces faecalis]|uniref:FadR/GntR family transcriptional regulator n=1 Tax=Actinomyces faecalis TaxID=2722820 RepID=UPI0015541F09|nr:FadR/GntR family transcriptional regulator [Actinomyces faecalis]
MSFPPPPSADDSAPLGSSRTAEQLLELILESGLRPGDRLPAERTLVNQLGVGRSAVREAIRTIEFLGLVETIGGSGTYVRNSVNNLLPTTLKWGMMLSRGQTEDLHQVRAALEVSAVEVASRRYNPQTLAELESFITQQEGALEDPAHFVEADAAFHLHITTVAGNAILADLLVTTRSLLRVWDERSVHDPADMRDALREHAMIVKALKNGEAANAAAAMRLHMMTAQTRLLAAIPTEQEAGPYSHPISGPLATTAHGGMLSRIPPAPTH